MLFMIVCFVVAAMFIFTGSDTIGEADTESTTEQITEVITTEVITEAPTTEITTTEKKTEQVTTEAKTEATTEAVEEPKSSIDINGYGWVELQYSAPYNIMEGHLTRSNGSIRVFGHRETWYSTNEACGVVTARDIPGKHVADDGTIRDEHGYICVASSDHSFYSIVMTSVGPGKVYDCGCSHGTIDVYTNW